MKYFLGVDVGTNSVRVGLFDSNGNLINIKTESIQVFNFKADFYEQSSEEIWNNVCKCINAILETHGEIKDNIVSIGIDATCSLVVLDSNFHPVSVNLNGCPETNVITWMDHRAKEQAEFINSTNYQGLKSVGGSISPEMDPPKILWLKQNLYDSCYKRAEHFFSLPDYLVWRFTNQNIRSVCTTTCKWLLKSEPNCTEWDEKFWKLIGLEDLCLNKFSKIGSTIEKPFKYCEILQVSSHVAKQTGLSHKTRVGVSMIDAHAGGIGGLCLTFGYLELNRSNPRLEKYFSESDSVKIEDILVLVSGTSSCFMASTKEPKFITGVWGPYYEAMVPFMWLNEGGQSASGKLIDHVIQTHPAYELLRQRAGFNGIDSVYAILDDLLKDISKEENIDNLSLLTKNVHVYPDFHGNRSPLADPNMTGQICGLTFDTSLKNLAIMYLAFLQSLAYQTRHIIEEMNSHDIKFKIMNIIGGLAKNRLYCQLISDVCQLPVLIPNKPDSTVLFGSAVVGSSSFEEYKSFNFEQLVKLFSLLNNEAMSSNLLIPNGSTEKYHELKYKVYKAMIEDQFKYRSIMGDV